MATQQWPHASEDGLRIADMSNDITEIGNEQIADLNQVAAQYGLTIKQIYGMRQYVVRDDSTNVALVTYKEWEYMTLTAETLEADIEEAIENYEPKDMAEIRAAEIKARERRRSLVSGRFI